MGGAVRFDLQKDSDQTAVVQPMAQLRCLIREDVLVDLVCPAATISGVANPGVVMAAFQSVQLGFCARYELRRDSPKTPTLSIAQEGIVTSGRMTRN